MSVKGLVDPNKLSPTTSTAHSHIMRVYFQCLVWRSLDQCAADPTHWGWKLDDDIYSPVVTNSDCAPSDILQFIRCKCKAGCTTNLCSCKKHGLKCVFACKNCRGDCENGEVITFIYTLCQLYFLVHWNQR